MERSEVTSNLTAKNNVFRPSDEETVTKEERLSFRRFVKKKKKKKKKTDCAYIVVERYRQTDRDREKRRLCVRCR